MKPKSVKQQPSLGKSEVLLNPKRKGRPPGKTGNREAARAKLIGKVFDRLTVINVTDKGVAHCTCVCGKLWTGKLRHLRNGDVKSCGCMREEIRRANLQARQNLVGQKFGRLTVVEAPPSGHLKAICICGKTWTGRKRLLISREAVSCGCYHREVVGNLNVSHGHTKNGKTTKVYRAWRSMHRRCYETTEKNKHYKRKGIQVCKRWRIGEGQKSGFECFLSDMGNPPSKDHSIDRIDNDGHYTPENVRWATIEEQANNRDNNHPIELGGKIQNISQWSREEGVDYRLFEHRLRKGWDVLEALKRPARPLKKR